MQLAAHARAPAEELYLMARGLAAAPPRLLHLTFRSRHRHPSYMPPPIPAALALEKPHCAPKCLRKIRCRLARQRPCGAAAMCLARSRRSCGTGQRPHCCSTALTSRGVRRSVASKWTHRIYAAHAGQTCKNADCSPFWAHLRALHRTDRRQRALCPSAEATVLMCSCRSETRHTVIGHQGPPRHSSR